MPRYVSVVLDGILHQHHFRDPALPIHCDADHVDANAWRWLAKVRTILLRQPAEARLLPAADRFQGWARALAMPETNLDQNEAPTVIGDQIDFAVGKAHIARENPVATGNKKTLGDSLPCDAERTTRVRSSCRRCQCIALGAKRSGANERRWIAQGPSWSSAARCAGVP